MGRRLSETQESLMREREGMRQKEEMNFLANDAAVLQVRYFLLFYFRVCIIEPFKIKTYSGKFFLFIQYNTFVCIENLVKALYKYIENIIFVLKLKITLCFVTIDFLLLLYHSLQLKDF